MKKIWYAGLILAAFLGVGCGTATQETITEEQKVSLEVQQETQKEVETENAQGKEEKSKGEVKLDETKGESPSLDLAEVPQYEEKAYIELNDNVPYFSEEELTTEAFETYSELDSLGRCGEAYANVCEELMPTEERESISRVKPSGWQNVKYDVVEGRYLYNRCHLIGYQLAGENANENNLITGTRYMNMEGMLPFEDEVADYVKETNHHVLYRVTPEYEGDNLVADGVHMEAYSVEDHGAGVCFNVFVYNTQPGVVIDYADGSSQLAEDADEQVQAAETAKEAEKERTVDEAAQEENAQKDVVSEETVQEDVVQEDAMQQSYVVNTNTGKFHDPTCSRVSTIKAEHRQDVQENRQALIDEGYEPCKRCNP